MLPTRCLLCEDHSHGEALCRPCVLGLPFQGPCCLRCALESSDPSVLCGRCLKHPPPWDSATAALRYDFPVPTLVQGLKYQRQLSAGRALAQAMEAGDHPDAGDAPLLIPVPLHWLRESWRGFNQANELALHLSLLKGWSVDHRHLRRRRRTPAQSTRSARDRARNLAGAFTWTGPKLAGRTVVLVDDVLTTGATAAACCHALRDAGEIHLWVAARTPAPGR